MKLVKGLRVVRGPDWPREWGDLDGGEGGVGTVVNVNETKEKDQVNSVRKAATTVRVQWDWGGPCYDYRCGMDSKFDLRVFDTAQVGIVHRNPDSTHCFTCHSCKGNGVVNAIIGMRFKCFECKVYDYNLCTMCYNAGEHYLEHRFYCIEEYGGGRTLLPPRANSRKLIAKGLFIGAEVVRGLDWSWGDSDGGARNPGDLIDINGEEFECAYRCVGRVIWKETRQDAWYHIGHNGKVDVQYTKPANGGYYYPDHLPVLGKSVSEQLQQPSNDQFKPGDAVHVNTTNQATFKSMQKDHGGWKDTMSEVMSKVGIVQSVLESGDIQVLFPRIGDYMYTINPKALSMVKVKGEKESSASHGHGDDASDGKNPQSGDVPSQSRRQYTRDGVTSDGQRPQSASTLRRQWTISDHTSEWKPVGKLTDRPILQKLMSFESKKKGVFDITERVGTKYTKLGIFLLEDDLGNKVDALVRQNQMDAASINYQILRSWIQGHGMKPTWETLIKVLFKIQLPSLAEDIKESLEMC